MSVAWRLLHYLWREKRLIGGGILFTALMGLVEVGTGSILKMLTDAIEEVSRFFKHGGEGIVEIPLKFKIPMPGSKGKFHLLDTVLSGADEVYRGMLYLAIAVVLLYLGKALFEYSRELCMNAAIQRILRQFRQEIFAKLLNLPVRFHDTSKSGDLVSRVTYDVTTLERVLELFIEIARTTVYAIVFIPVMFYINVKITLFTVLFFPLSWMLIRRFSGRISHVGRAISETVGSYTAVMQEKIRNLRTIKGLSSEAIEKSRFDTLVEENYRHFIRMIRLKYIMKPSNELIGMIGVAIVFVYFAKHLVYGDTSLGNVVLYLYLMQQAYKPVKKVAFAFGELYNTLVCTGRIFALLDEPEEKAEGSVAVPSGGVITFSGINFAYNGSKPVLQNLSCTFSEGITGLTGASGSGKTTICALIKRFYEPSDGIISYGEKPIAAMPLAAWRSLVAYAGPDSALFTGTVAENLRYNNPDSTEEQIARLLPLLGMSTTAELNHEIGEGGRLLAQGMREKLLLARALLRTPRILIIDELLDTMDSEQITAFYNYFKQIPLVIVVSKNNQVLAQTQRVIRL